MMRRVLLFPFILYKPTVALPPRVFPATKSQEVWPVLRKPSEKEEHRVFGRLIAIPHRPCPLNLRFCVLYLYPFFRFH
jgi:hypothetical protein